MKHRLFSDLEVHEKPASADRLQWNGNLASAAGDR